MKRGKNGVEIDFVQLIISKLAQFYYVKSLQEKIPDKEKERVKNGI